MDVVEIVDGAQFAVVASDMPISDKGRGPVKQGKHHQSGGHSQSLRVAGADADVSQQKAQKD